MDASRDPDRSRIEWNFTGFRISPAVGGLVRNDGCAGLRSIVPGEGDLIACCTAIKESIFRYALGAWRYALCGFFLEIQFELHEVEVREGAEFTLELRLSGGTAFRAVTKIDAGSNEDFGVVRWRPGQYGLNLAGRIFP